MDFCNHRKREAPGETSGKAQIVSSMVLMLDLTMPLIS
jgi:hypothetical protein